MRRLLRAAGLAALLLVLVLAGGALYLNKIGLPGFIKRSLQAELRDRGVDLEFSRVRLRWHRGMVAENVTFGSAQSPDGPRLHFEEIQLRFNKPALARLEFQAENLDLRNGSFVWPVHETNQTDRAVFIDDIQTLLRFEPDDRWELDRFEAVFAEARVHFTASLTNASAIREWTFLRPRKPADARTINRRLRQLLDLVESLKFDAAPDLEIVLRGDAKNPRGLHGQLELTAAGADTPWGKLGRGRLTAQVLPPGNSNSTSQAGLTLDADTAVTRWGEADRVKLVLGLVTDPRTTNSAHAEMLLHATHPKTKWGEADGLNLSADWDHQFTTPMPSAGQVVLEVTNAHSPRGGASFARLNLTLREVKTNSTSQTGEQRGWWANLDPYEFDWATVLDDVTSPQIVAARVRAAGSWSSPVLVLTNLHTRLYGGEVDASATLDVDSRELRVQGGTDFDLHDIDHLLTEKSRRWINQFSWREPPKARAELFVTLPAWTNRSPDWRGEVRPTLVLTGEVETASCAFRGVPADSATTHFFYSNMVWHLPDLVIQRPEGRLDIIHKANDRTQDYYWHVRSTIDPRALRPLLGTNADRAFELISYDEPPRVDAEIRGRWYRHDLIGARGHVSAGRFSLRGQEADSVEADFSYTNLVLELANAIVRKGDLEGTVEGLRADFPEHKVYLTNAVSRLDPLMIARAIGPRTGETMEPYRFAEPPLGRVNGVAPIHDMELADLHFEVEGGPFQWWLFNTRHIKGDLHWKGMGLVMTNVQMEFYGGGAGGHAGFGFSHDAGTDFQFDLSITNTSLRGLMADLSPSTNRLEGTLGGQLVVRSANTHDPLSWQGGGNVTLTNGYLWNIPMFGIFSPVLDAFWPGLGNSIADQGTATFSIGNSLIHSDDLEIRAPMMRMKYRGTVDFQGNVNARVEAELWRDAWLIGKAMGMILTPFTKLFEYEVTGTLSEPRSEPRYVPKIFLMPFHPFRTLKELFTPEEETSPAPIEETVPATE